MKNNSNVLMERNQIEELNKQLIDQKTNPIIRKNFNEDQKFWELFSNLSINIPEADFFSIANQLETESNEVNEISDRKISDSNILCVFCDLISNTTKIHEICSSLLITFKNIIRKSKAAQNQFIFNHLENSLLELIVSFDEYRPEVIDIISIICQTEGGCKEITESNFMHYLFDLLHQLLFLLEQDINVNNSKIPVISSFLFLIKLITYYLHDETQPMFENIIHVLNLSFDSQHSHNFDKICIEILINLINNSFEIEIYQSEILFKVLILLDNETNRTSFSLIVHLISLYFNGTNYSFLNDFYNFIPFPLIIKGFIIFIDDNEYIFNCLNLFNRVIPYNNEFVLHLIENDEFILSLKTLLSNSIFNVRKSTLRLIWTLLYFGPFELKLTILDSEFFDFLEDSFYDDDEDFVVNCSFKSLNEVMSEFDKNGLKYHQSYQRILSEIVPVINELCESSDENIRIEANQFMSNID